MTTLHRNTLQIFAAAIFLALPAAAAAGEGYRQPFDCFAVVVGRLASADGSVITAHNEDVLAPAVKYFKVPHLTHPAGERITLREGGKVRQASETLGYLWVNVPGWDVCDSYMNESGVIISSDGCPSREDKPDLTDGGIVFWLRRIVAERARTAREGVGIAGKLIDQFGYNSSGRSYVIADKNEAWILAVVMGKHWVAERVPDDKVVVIPNCFTIQGVDLSDTLNFLGSPDIIEYAARRGWYDSARDGQFNFAKAYSNPGSLTHPGNIYRWWSGLRRVSGKSYDTDRQMPFAVEPQGKLTVRDVMAVMRDHFEGTSRDSSAGGTAGDPHTMDDPSVCCDMTRYSFVAQLRGWLPPEIGPIMWIALYNPDVQGYSAWYPGITRVPAAYTTGDHASGLRAHLDPSFSLKKVKRPEAFTRCLALNDTVRREYTVRVAAIEKAWKTFEDSEWTEQAEFEKGILKTPAPGHDHRVRMITEYVSASAMKLFARTRELMRALK